MVMDDAGPFRAALGVRDLFASSSSYEPDAAERTEGQDQKRDAVAHRNAFNDSCRQRTTIFSGKPELRILDPEVFCTRLRYQLSCINNHDLKK